MKKTLLLSLSAVLAISLASCGGKDDSKTIKFWHTMGKNLTEILDPAIEQFEKDNPEWKIESTTIGSYNDVRNQTISYIAAGSNPDLVYVYPDHVAKYNVSGAVIDLNKFINDKEIGFTKEQKKDFIEGYYAEGSVYGDDALYTLPFSKSTEALYYDKTFFEDEGLLDTLLNKGKSYEGVPTWDSLDKVMKIIKVRYPDSTPLGIDSESNHFITYAEQTGAPYTSATGDHYLFNNDTNKNGVKMLKDWYDQGLVTTKTILTTYTSSLFVKEDSKRSYLSIGSTGGATHQVPEGKRFEVGIAPQPQFVDENGNVSKKAISQGPSLAMLKQKTEEKEKMTFKFVKDYLLTTEFQAKFSIASGYNPVLKSVYENQVYKGFLGNADGYDGIAALAAKTSRDMEEYYYVSPAFNGSSAARDEVGNIIYNVLKGIKPMDKAFSDALRACKGSR